MSFYTNNEFNEKDTNYAWSKIAKFTKPNTKILDVGCSSGRLGAALKADKNVHVIGVDLDKADIQLAKKNLDEAFVLDVEHDNLDKLGLFDFVIMADVIEHLVNPVDVLRKAKTLLKPGGMLIFSIPNMSNGLVRMELLKGRFEYTDWGLLDRTHLHYYDQKEVEQIFNEAGLKISETDCTIKNIPRDVLKKQLEELGLSISEKFIKHINSPESAVFQFIGCAVPSSKVEKLKVESKSPLDAVDRRINEISNAYEKVVSDYEKDVIALQAKLRQVENEKQEVVSRLNEIVNSKSWKILEKAHAVNHKLISLKKHVKE